MFEFTRHAVFILRNPPADHWSLISGLPTYVAENGLVSVDFTFSRSDVTWECTFTPVWSQEHFHTTTGLTLNIFTSFSLKCTTNWQCETRNWWGCGHLLPIRSSESHFPLLRNSMMHVSSCLFTAAFAQNSSHILKIRSNSIVVSHYLTSSKVTSRFFLFSQ